MSLSLSKSLNNFINSTGLRPKIGCELEFYIFDNELIPLVNDKIADFINYWQNKSQFSQEFNFLIEREVGVSQIEIKIPFDFKLKKIALSVADLKRDLLNFATIFDYNISFAGQPIINDCGSSLQFNISLHDKNDNNIFNNEDNIHKFCNILLDKTPLFINNLVSSLSDWERFDFHKNVELFKLGKHIAPINLSYGFDNRTCAIRIAKSQVENNSKRIEYRVACADCNPELIMIDILVNCQNFLDYQLPKKNNRLIYGNAFDYDLVLLSALIPGNSSPSSHSRKAPPAVDI